MKNETERQILEAAKKVFIAKGFDGARMQEIADEANINKAMLHYYFRSKDLLFETILVTAMEGIMPLLVEALSGDGTVMEKIERLVDAYMDNIIEQPHIPLFLLHELSQRRLKVASSMVERMRKVEQPDRFMQQISDEVNAGMIRSFDPRQVMMNIMGLIIFPFVGRPIFKNLFQLGDQEYRALMMERKQVIKEFVRSALLP